MSKRANPTLIGAFVVGAVILAVAAIVLLSSGQLFKDTSQYVLYFEGSVKGLSIGSPVTFRGVNIGTVTNIQLVESEITSADGGTIKIPVVIEIDHTKFIHEHEGDSTQLEIPDSEEEMKQLIKIGLRAQLQLQSLLTGQLFIQIDYYPGTPIKLVGDKHYVEIPTMATPIEKLGKKLENFPFDKVLKDISSTMKGINTLVNSPELHQSITALHTTLDELRTLINRIDRTVDPLAANMNGVLKDARATLGHVDDTLDDAGTALRQARSTLDSAEHLVTDEQLLNQLDNALREIAGAARSVRVLADSIDQQPESLIKGRRR